MSDNDNTDSKFAGFYKGIPTEIIIDENGRQIRKPDLSSTFSSTTTNNIREFKYEKTLNEAISDTDKTRFSKLQNDEEKYEMISNMITTGEGNNHPNQLFSKRYVHGDPRSLIQMLEDLIEQKKIWLNPQNGDLYSYEIAIKEHMISFPCRNCSKVLFSEEERTRHSFSHISVQ